MISPEGSPDAPLRRAASGYRTTLIAQGVRFLCKIAGVVVLARLVAPAAHGVFAMAASVSFLLLPLRDLGTSGAAIQVPVLSPGQETALGWLYAGLGCALGGLSWTLAPVAAAFYAEPAVRPVLHLLAIPFALTGLSAVPRMLLGRSLRFTQLNLVDGAGALIGTAAMIAAGAAGAGAASLAWFSIVSEAVMLGLLWSFAPWRPAAPADWRALRPLVATGLRITGFNLVVYCLQQSPVLLMGRWFGPVPVGLYNRTGQLLQQPTLHLAQPFSQVLLATLSRLGPDSPGFARHFRETTTTIAHCTFPIAMVALVLPREVIWFVLGPAWLDGAPMLRWIALGALATYPSATLFALAIAAGRPAALLQAMAATLPPTFFALWIGAAHGPAGMAAGVAVVNLLCIGPQLWWVSRRTPVRGRDCLESFIGPAGVSCALALGLWLGQLAAGGAGAGARLLAGCLGAALAGAVCVYAWPRARTEWAYLRTHLPFARPSPPPEAV